MPIRIDDAFISEWHPKYDEIEDDECEYQGLVEMVRAEGGNISKKTFLRIWNWKGATRVIRFASIYVEGQLTKANKPEEDQYESLYASAFRKVPRCRRNKNSTHCLEAPRNCLVFGRSDSISVLTTSVALEATADA